MEDRKEYQRKRQLRNLHAFRERRRAVEAAEWLALNPWLAGLMDIRDMTIGAPTIAEAFSDLPELEAPRIETVLPSRPGPKRRR